MPVKCGARWLTDLVKAPYYGSPRQKNPRCGFSCLKAFLARSIGRVRVL